MVKSLNAKQQELVELNHNLIYKFANERNLSVDDYYDILAIGLCLAATVYDENKGKFSTIAYRCMDNEVKTYWRHNNTQSAVPESMVLSYDAPNKDDNHNNNGFLNSFVDSYSTQDIVINDIMQKMLINMLDGRERTIVQLIMSGMKQIEIAEMMNCTRQNVGAIVQKIRKKLTVYLDNN